LFHVKHQGDKPLTALDKLSDHLANLDKGTSPRPGCFLGAGEFTEADAAMLAALWDNRNAILEALADIVRRDEPSEGYPSDLAASLINEPRPMTGFFARMTDTEKAEALAYRGEDCLTRENPCAEISLATAAFIAEPNKLVDQVPTSSLSQALSRELRGSE
jgi:hypothetical protein